jgi:hypothetical protein
MFILQFDATAAEKADQQGVAETQFRFPHVWQGQFGWQSLGMCTGTGTRRMLTRCSRWVLMWLYLSVILEKSRSA